MRCVGGVESEEVSEEKEEEGKYWRGVITWVLEVGSRLAKNFPHSSTSSMRPKVILFKYIRDNMNKQHQCPICVKSMRSDNLKRHIKTHKNEIKHIMTKEQLEFCLKNRWPLIKIGYNNSCPIKTKMCHCLICGETTAANSVTEIEKFLNTYQYKHGSCIAHFEDVKHCYESTADVLPRTEASNIIVDEADSRVSSNMFELQDKCKKLETELNEINEKYDKHCDETTTEVSKLYEQQNQLINSLGELIYKVEFHSDKVTIQLFENQINKCRMLIKQIEKHESQETD